MCIKKYCDYYYSAKRVEGGYTYVIYNQYSKGREEIERGSEVVETVAEAEQDARDAISYYYI